MGRYSGRSFRLILMCVVSLLLFGMELVIAYVGNSLSLASDAFAVLSHFVSMIIGFFGVRASNIKQHRKSTYGFLRADVVGAFGNSIFAVALMFSILVEAVKRYINPQKTEAPVLVLTAGVVGLFFNLLNYVIFLDCCYCAAPRPQGDTETEVAEVYVSSILMKNEFLLTSRIDDPELVLIVGALGLAVNVVGLLIFQDCAAWFACCVRGRRHRPPQLVEGGTPGPLGAAQDVEGQRHSATSTAPGSDSAVILRGASIERKREKGATVFSNVAGDSLNTQNEPEETMKKEKKSEALNIRGVLLHVMGDALGSVVVVITAIIFYVLPLRPEDPCNWQCYIDPSLTIVMVIIILSSAFPLIKETAAILLQMVPKGLNMEELMSKLSAVPGIDSVHEVHIWELVSGKIIATLHIKCQKDKGYQDASIKIREIFHHAGIHNVTIQFENTDLKEPLEQKDILLLCSSPCISSNCAKHLCCPPGALPLAHVNGCAEHNGGLPIETYRSDDLSRRDATEVAIEVSLDSNLSNRGQALKSQEDQCYVNSTQF
ncbi:Zinc transporter 10 [Tupaia chinensis]|uniref:Zinc transporter 10 n=1 Tax=Tupaia chinensis TaxID=246437 RepID=L9LBY4_TUPCH|nr:Zinc transporter 10 [Tupaia chinensis]